MQSHLYFRHVSLKPSSYERLKIMARIFSSAVPSPVPNQTVRRDVGGQDVAQEPQAGTSGAIETVDLAGSASESSEDEDQPPKEEIDAAREQVAFQLVKEILANPQTGPP